MVSMHSAACTVSHALVRHNPIAIRLLLTIASCKTCCRHVRIASCTDCTIVLGAVASLLRIENCENVQVIATARQLCGVNCHSCSLFLGTPRPPIFIGDNRFVTLAPYNTRYQALLTHMQQAGLAVGQPSMWDHPLVVSSRDSIRKPINSNSPSSPHTHMHAGSWNGTIPAPRPVLLMPPDDFLPFVIPFRWGATIQIMQAWSTVCLRVVLLCMCIGAWMP